MPRLAGSRLAASHMRFTSAMPAARRGAVSRGLVWLLLPGYQASPNLMARRSAPGLSPPTQIGGCGFCSGLGIEQHVGEAHVLAAIGGRVFGPQLAEGLEALVGDLAALLERGAQQLELLLHPARAGADDQPAVGEHVDGRQHLGRQHRRPMRHHHHRRQQPQPLGAAGEEGDGRELVEAMPMLGGGKRRRSACRDSASSSFPGTIRWSLTERKSKPARSAALATAM